MVRVRFAPSPTGYLHVGGARTALFNWLYARRHGGTFVLRIEDTDAERSSWEMVSGIVDGLRWLGLDWDEGPDIGGPHAPYFQSQRLDRYRAMAAQLVAERAARTTATARRRSLQQKRAGGRSGRRRLDLRPHVLRADARSRSPRAKRPARRARSASRCRRARRPSTISCTVRSSFANANIEDFVVLRSDGQPTYHLSVVVDDIDMEITHVVRGDDHISNTPKQVLLYQAFERPRAGVRARAADPRARQEAPEQAARRDVGDGVSAARLSARSDGELPGAARLVARRRPGAVHARRADRRGSRSKGSAAATPCSTPRSWTGSTSST